MDAKEAEKRSPMYMETPVKKRASSKLYIYEGIHDGYTGSVPITQSINIYNKIVSDLIPVEKEAIVPENDIMEMLASQNFVASQNGTIGNRIIHYRKTFEDKVRAYHF